MTRPPRTRRPEDAGDRSSAQADEPTPDPDGAADDNALESLGKAVIAPVLGAAGEDPDSPVQQHPAQVTPPDVPPGKK